MLEAEDEIPFAHRSKYRHDSPSPGGSLQPPDVAATEVRRSDVGVPASVGVACVKIVVKKSGATSRVSSSSKEVVPPLDSEKMPLPPIPLLAPTPTPPLPVEDSPIAEGNVPPVGSQENLLNVDPEPAIKRQMAVMPIPSSA